KLTAPESVLDAFPGAMDFLSSEGLIIRARRLIGFFHESFFDYIFARAFVTGNQSLFQLLTSTEQNLFRRTQTRQILETLRQDDAERYIRELESVLRSEEIRYHIKLAVVQWLGTQPDPTEQEHTIVLKLQHGSFSSLVRFAMFGSVGWFERLNQNSWLLNVL